MNPPKCITSVNKHTRIQHSRTPVNFKFSNNQPKNNNKIKVFSSPIRLPEISINKKDENYAEENKKMKFDATQDIL